MCSEKEIKPRYRIIVADVEEKKLVIDERCFSIVGGICALAGDGVTHDHEIAFAECTGDLAIKAARAAEDVSARVRREVEDRAMDEFKNLIKNKFFGGKK